jgi:polysaccharide pyruvyl transferase WcaK-like protein
LLIGILLRKPVVVYAQSIGPFETVLTRFLARFVLNKVSLIIVRESISENYLNINRISRPDVVLTSDSAFLLDPISPIEAKSILAKEGVDVENRPIFGVAMSQIIHRWMFPDCRDSRRKYELYTDTMARVADYLVERFDSTVILLSQCIGKFARHDDRIAAMETYRKVVHPDRVKVILGQYTPSELKGVIGCCQLMVSSKMHSAIAAVTMLVPTVVLAYSYKTQGIFGRKLGMTHLIVDVRHSNSKTLFEEITEKIDHAWSSRKRISNVLHEKVNIEKKQAIRSAILAAGLIAD